MPLQERERRKVLITTQVTSGVLALILGLMVVTDIARAMVVRRASVSSRAAGWAEGAPAGP